MIFFFCNLIINKVYFYSTYEKGLLGNVPKKNTSKIIKTRYIYFYQNYRLMHFKIELWEWNSFSERIEFYITWFFYLVTLPHTFCEIFHQEPSPTSLSLCFRFSGVYVITPQDPQHPRPFNGHAYISDPFAEFKPDDLSEINSLAGESSPHPPPEVPFYFSTSPSAVEDLQTSVTKPRPFSMMLDVIPVSPKQGQGND